MNAHEPKIKSQIELDMSRTVTKNEENKEINILLVVFLNNLKHK